MNIKLQSFKINSARGNSLTERFRFAVVDLDKSRNYPENYVCMLPLDIGGNGRYSSVFLKIFGDKSLSLAMQLLKGLLETTTDGEVKVEIERRLRILEIYAVKPTKCIVCGRLFMPKRRRGSWQTLCVECENRKTDLAKSKK